MHRRSFLTGLLASAAAAPMAPDVVSIRIDMGAFASRTVVTTFRANRIVQSIEMADDHLKIVERFKAAASLHAQMEQRDEELKAFFEGSQWAPPAGLSPPVARWITDFSAASKAPSPPSPA